MRERKALEDLKETQGQYGPLPSDYLAFAAEIGDARLFRSQHGRWYSLSINVPPVPNNPIKKGHIVRLKVGHFVNTGDAWFECANGLLLHGGAVISGLTKARPQSAGSFADWVQQSFAAAKKLYTDEEWKLLLTEEPQFNSEEQRVLEAAAQFTFRKIGVTDKGAILVQVSNGSRMELPRLTIGVRSKEAMEGSIALSTSGIAPGSSKVLERAIYKDTMDPHSIDLFRLPTPDPEDRPYFFELRDIR